MNHVNLWMNKGEYVIARTRHDEYQYEGIKVIDIADWLLDNKSISQK